MHTFDLPPMQRRFTFVWALLVLTASLVVGCGSPGAGAPTPPPSVTPATDGRLLYTRDSILWTMDVASGKATEIVRPPELGQVHSARWSPDGSKIAYGMYEVRDRRTPVAEIYIATATGSGASKLVKAEQAATFFQAPVWGPDGKIYYMHTATSAGARVRQIERIDLASGKTETVIEEVGAFDISRDGKHLALVRSENGGVSLVLVDLATSQPREVVARGPFETISAPRFDPGSRTVVFSGSRVGGAALRPSDGSLLASLVSLLIPTPVQAHGTPQDLWTVPVMGGAVSQLAKLDADEPVAAWSPDGGKVAILSSEALQSLEVASGNRKPILTPGSYGSVDWAR